MSEVKDGGPAFPYSALQPDAETRQLVGSMYADNTGMTLRDYFAAKAMHAEIVVPRPAELVQEGSPSPIEQIAGRAYLMADAMLKAREATAGVESVEVQGLSGFTFRVCPKCRYEIGGCRCGR